jgi:cysteine-rich repeat protein
LLDARSQSLAIDPTAFATLRVNSHETGPGWQSFPDPESKERYRMSAFPATWGAEYFRRLLQPTIADPRYAGGEGLVITWPTNFNFHGQAAVAAHFRVRRTANGPVTFEPAAMPFFRFAELVARMGDDVAPLPVAEYDGTVLSGPPSTTSAVISGWRSVEPTSDRIVLYAHDPLDEASREPDAWTVNLNLSNLRFPLVKVSEYRIDRETPYVAAFEALRSGVGLKAGSCGFFPNGTHCVYGPNATELAAVDAVLAEDVLAPAAPPTYVYRDPNGDVALTPRLLSQGIVYLEIAEEKCGNGILEAGEQCDDGNRSDADCCGSDCAPRNDGQPCNDFNGCTGTEGSVDHCSGGACVGGDCDVGTTCPHPCGVQGSCQVNEGSCVCMP